MTTPTSDPVDEHWNTVAPMFATLADQAIDRIVRHITPIIDMTDAYPDVVQRLSRMFKLDPRTFQ